MLILKENAANSVPTPPVGKDTFFIDDSGVPSVKNAAGSVTTFPTVVASNAQVVFLDGSSLSGENAFTYDFNNNVLNVSGNIAVGNLKTDNLLYANGTPWDLSDPGGSNTQIQFNDDESFGGSAAFTFNKSTNTVSIGNTLSVTGNASAGNVNAGNLLTANFVTGTLTTAAQPNITSVGTLTSLTVSGNISGGNITGGALANGNSNVNIPAAAGNVNISVNGTANVAVVTATGVNVAGTLNATGNANVGNIGATNGVFAANVSAGNLSLSGNAVVSGNLTVDGNLVYVNVETLAVEDPIIQLQTGPNGATPAANSGKDVGSALNYYDSAARVAFMGWDVSNAEFGLASQSTITNEVVTFNTYGNLRAGVYFGNAAGLVNIPGGNIVGNIAGNISNATHAVTANTVVDAAQPNITSVGTLSSVSVSGNANVGNLGTTGLITASGNVSGGNINATGAVVASTLESNVANGTAPLVVTSQTKVANLNADLLDGFSTATTATANTVVNRDADGSFSANVVTANLSGNATTAGTVTTAAQPNITSVGTLTGLGVNGNIAAPNITANSGAFYGSGAGLTNIPAGNITGQVANALVAGTVYTNAQPNITSVGTLTSLAVTGNASAGNLSATGDVSGATLTGTLTTAAQPNITSVGTLTSLAVTGNGTFGNVYANSGTIGASLLTGTLTTAAQPNVTSVGTLTSLAVTGNATAGNVYANSGTIGASLLTGTLTTAAQPNVTSLGTLTGLGVNGNITAANITANTGVFTGNGSGLSALAGANVTGQVANATVAGTVYTAAQPNITSVGTLTSLGVNGNITAANITANTGVFTGNAAGLTNIPGGNITGNITGNISNANYAAFAGQVVDSTQSNITSVGTLTSLSVTGNVSAGNLNTAGKVVASTLESNVAQGTAPLVVASTTKVANLNADLLDGYSTATAATANTVVIRDADGSFSANVVTANLSGNATTAGTVVTAAQPNITSVGTLTGLGVNGTVTAVAFTANTGVFTGNGNGLSSLVGANVTGQVANALVAGTVYTAAQSNITSVGTLTGLDVNGNITAANITANTGVFTGNANGLSSLQGANVVGTINSTTLGNSSLFVGTTSIALNRSSGAQSLTGITSIDGYAATVSTAAQPNITSVGTLTGLGVNGNITAANITANTGVFTGNGSGLSQLAGANVTGQVANAAVAGTVYTAAQPNITSVGTLSSLSVTGNVAAGNLTTTGVLSVTGTGVSSIAGNLDMTSNNIINLATPVNATDAATKQYVDDVAQGLNIHDSCAAATPDTLANITSGTITYDNGTAGVGAFLATTGTFNLIDGVNVQTAGTRILVKNEANAVFNGIYTYTNTTAITRAADFNSIPEVEAGDFTFITGGTLYDNTGWVQTESPTGIGTAGNNISFTQFSGAGTYNAGTGLTLTGPTFSVNASQTQVTALGTVTTGTWNSLVGSSATFAAGLSGANLNSITGGNVTGQVANALVAGTVYTAAQPNITSVGTLTGLGVNGTITGVNITANTGVFTGNANGLSSIQGANVVGTLNSTTLGNSSLFIGTTSIALNRGTGAQSLTGITSIDGYASTVSTAAQPNITSVGTLTSLTVTGNASAGNLNTAGAVVASTLTSNVTTGTAPLTVTSTTRVANLNVAYANVADFASVTTQSSGNAFLMFANALTGNVSETANAAFVANTSNGALYATTFIGALSGAATSATTAGTVTTAAQPNITSVGTLSGLTVSATITGSVSGSAGTAGTVTTAAQPNITSVGTLTSLSSSGNITAPNLIANTGFVISSVNAAVSAAGTVQANATALTTEVNVTSTVASGAGVALPTAVAGMRVTIINTAANAVLVYPASGGTINSLALNAAFSQAAGARLDFVATSTTQWYTLNATYL